MCTLISMVGLQPAAIATTAKTLLMHGDLKKVILLPTEATKNEYNRLERYLRESLHIPPEMINAYYISTDVAKPKSGYALAWEAIKKYLDQECDMSQPVYFDTSPGLNYQVALISYHLKGDQRFQAIYADNRKLHNLRNGASWDLENIGFKELLQLYGLQEKSNKAPANLGDAVDDVIIVGGKERLPLVSACERYGRFYGLYMIWKKEGLAGDNFKKESHRVKQEARLIESIEETPDRLNRLNPIWSVWTNDELTQNRLRASAISTILEMDNSRIEKVKQKFINKVIEKPGSVPPEKMIEPMRFTGGSIEALNPEGIWESNNLIVVLGSDPASTLLAFFTHKPRELIILVDEKNPAICVLAARIKQQSKNIPAKQITFWPMDLLGNIRDMDQFVTYVGNADWAMNITPGTKAHSWKFARLPVRSIWSLVDQRQKAQTLIENKTFSPIPYDFPPITVQASVVGGWLSTEGISKEELLKKKEFLMNMCNVIGQIIKSEKSGWLKKIKWEAEKTLQHDGKNYIKCLQVDRQNEAIEFDACFQGHIASGWVKSLPDMGHWFEEVVAGAFLNAGGRDIEDIRVGLRWGWLHAQQNSRHFRNDLDIVVLWKGHYIGVSCKIGVQEDALEKERTDVIAVTRTGLGRFALPVIVRGGIKPKEASRVAEATLRTEPMELGMSLLSERTAMNVLMVSLLVARRTAL